MDNLEFKLQPDGAWLARFYHSRYSRFYEIKDNGGHAILKIYGSNREANTRHQSVEKCMEIANQKHKVWLAALRKKEVVKV